MPAFHDGELAVQRRAGVASEASSIGHIIRDTIPANFAEFLVRRELVITATTSEEGAVNASLLTGPAGFARAIDPHSVRIDPTAGHVRAVLRDLDAHRDIGLLAIDFNTRRRIRVNGTASLEGSSITIATREVYGNCQQYIHAQSSLVTGNATRQTNLATLDDDACAWIGASERFFIASAHAARGADASHRGGEPGFVTATETRVTFPDYPGNNMFNTLGNLEVDPRCGLLFIDFVAQRTLQVNGLVSIIWSGSERSISVDVQRAIVTRLP